MTINEIAVGAKTVYKIEGGARSATLLGKFNHLGQQQSALNRNTRSL